MQNPRHISIMRVRECWKGMCSRLAAGSAIALTGAIRMLVLPHAVTAGASLYIKTGIPDRRYASIGWLDLSILAFSLAFQAITLQIF